MQIRNLHQPFEIEFIETDAYSAKEHSNTFFELVFILEGRGIQSINNHQLPYSNDKLFLIFPKDKHGFEVHTSTKFFFIRFNDSYLKMQSKDWIQKIEFIFHRHNHLPGCILKNITDKPFIRSLVETLIREQNNDHPHKLEVIQQIINTMLTIAARNITLMLPPVSSVGQEQDSMQLLNYIHQNIYQPEQLKSEYIAAFFNIAPTYISEYFKSKTGQSLQQYISDYRMKLLETRLRYTNMQINEIVYEFGFTDASHLNRLFRKHRNMSPSAFRKMHLPGLSFS